MRISDKNSTYIPLNSGQTFIGSPDRDSEYPDLKVDIETDQDGILTISLSTDGINYQNKTYNYLSSASSEELFNPYVEIKGHQYVRISFQNTSGSNQTYMRLHTEFGTFRDVRKSQPVEFTTNSNSTYPSVSIYGSQGAFGNLMVDQLEPLIQLSYIYNLNNTVVDTDPGTMISVIQEGDGSNPKIQTISPTSGSQFTASGASDYFFLYAGGGGQFYVWFRVDATSTDPAPGGTGIQVDINSSDNNVAVGTAIQSAVDANVNFSASVLIGNVVQITNAANGNSTSIQPATMPTTTTSTVTHIPLTSTARISSCQGIGSYASFRSDRGAKYRPGQGMISRFTAKFDDGLAGTGQLAGCGNQVSGLFFGYNGADFSILHRKSGQPEIRKLQITGAASGSETATIRVDGVDFTVALTSGTVQHNAYEIASSDAFKTGQWKVDAVDDTVIILSETATGERGNTYSFSSSTATGTWTQETAGVAIDNEYIAQSSWNVDKLDGTGASGMTLDPQKANVYSINFQWLGAGSIYFNVENPSNGEFVLVHQIKYANSQTVPSFTNPNLKMIYAVFNSTATSSRTLDTFSFGMFNEGKIKLLDPYYSQSTSYTTSTANEEVFFVLKNRRTFSGKGNSSEIIPLELQISNDANKSGTIRIYKDGSIGETSYNYIDESNSCAVFDGANATVPTDGKLFGSFVVAGNSSISIDLSKFNIGIHTAEYITFTAQRLTTTNIEIGVSFQWFEDQ